MKIKVSLVFLLFSVLALSSCIDGYGSVFFSVQNTSAVPVYCTLQLDSDSTAGILAGTEFTLNPGQVIAIASYQTTYNGDADSDAYDAGSFFPLVRFSVYGDAAHQNVLREWQVSSYTQLMALFSQDFDDLMTDMSLLGQFDLAKGLVLTADLLAI